MYNVASLKAGLIGLVGWRQNELLTGVQLTEMTTSSSGLWYNDQHPLLSFENLESMAPDFAKLTYPAWSAAVSYAVGAKVSLSGTLYIAIASSLNQTPPNATYWAIYSPFTAWLKERTEAGIILTVEDWISRKFEVKTAKSLIDRKQVFMTAARNTGTDENQGKTVGFEFHPMASRNQVLLIEKIGVRLTANQTLTVKLFSSAQPAALYTQAITYTGAGGEQWQEVNWEVPSGPAYYIVYEQAGLTGVSVNGVNSDTADLEQWPTYPFVRGLSLCAFSVEAGASTLWDISKNGYTTATNYGLNFRLNVKCDYTNFLLEQKDLFKALIAKGVAMSMLRELAYNPTTRVNRHEGTRSRENILYEIDGNPQGRFTGLKADYEKLMKTAEFDDSNMDPICLPCRRMGVSYGTVAGG